ncbi:MAG: polyketide-type polyunsaturated fatty acid synthase PfaA, partial [Desulfobacula sp.]|nr:polyketide-type polyunsaturated fatty acid synthase PfaA [Desulfobacula sp.]
INPVNFVENIESMLDKNVSVFIEVGPKAVLTGLIKPVLLENNITATSLDASSGKKSGIEDLAHVLCMIASKGFAVDLTQWEDTVKKPEYKKMRVQLSGANPKPKNNCSIPKSKPEPSQKQTINKNRSVLEGSDMTSQNTQKPDTQKIIAGNLASPAHEAMKMVQKGLEAMQQLQTQTARAHEKFLDTQAQASKTLASMMEQTRNFSLNTSITHSAPAPVMTEQMAEPVHQENNDSTISQPASNNNVTQELEPDTQIQTPQRVETDLSAESENNNSDAQTEQILFEIVSKLTGFPVEMLESDMDIESDLGIDSIKKVEIISELEKQIPSCEGLTTENIGSVRTLKDIRNAIRNETVSVIETTATAEVDTAATGSTESYQVVSTVLVNTISELTGFPVEMLEPSMNLESDLGIDSIKRVEILSKLEQEIDHIETISSDDIANLKTIEEIITYLTKNDQKTIVEVEKKTPASNDEPQKKSNQAESNNIRLDKELTRQVVSLQEYPTNQIRFYNGAKIELAVKKKVYITKDNSNIAKRFKTEFKKLGIDASLIDIGKGDIPELPDAAGLVLVPDSFSKNNAATSIDFLKSAFLLVKKNAGYLMDSGKEKGAFLTTVSFLGGGFGFSGKTFNSDPIYGGLAGLAKTASLEWKNVLCRALDMLDSKEKCMKNAEAAVSLMMTHGSVEMGLDEDSCNIPTLIDQDLNDGNVDLSPDDVVLITGGAKGVTAACAIEMAKKYSPTIILIGRSEAASSEPEWAK